MEDFTFTVTYTFNKLKESLVKKLTNKIIFNIFEKFNQDFQSK